MDKRLLIIAATELEIKHLLQQQRYLQQVDILVTGVGLLNTGLVLMKHLGRTTSYSKILQVGIAGSFDKSIPLAEVVEVTKEQMGDLGAENHQGFLPFGQKILTNKAVLGLREATSISVNTCSGNLNTIKNRIQQFNPTIENMEGYAFFNVCEILGLSNYHQIRAISNYVEPRNKDSWKAEEAIEQLNTFVLNLILT